MWSCQVHDVNQAEHPKTVRLRSFQSGQQAGRTVRAAAANTQVKPNIITSSLYLTKIFKIFLNQANKALH